MSVHLNMDEAERLDAQAALVEWFASQGINPLDACLMMAHTIGEIICRLSRDDPRARFEVIGIFEAEINRRANGR
jgi:hypothetical protein